MPILVLYSAYRPMPSSALNRISIIYSRILYYHFLPLGVQILIAGGDIDISNYYERIREYSRISADLPSSAYILEAHFHRDTYQIIEISYLDLPKMPIDLGICEDLFGCICDGRVVFGLGAYYTKDVFELTRGNRWKMLPNRKILRYFSASCYMKDKNPENGKLTAHLIQQSKK